MIERSKKMGFSWTANTPKAPFFSKFFIDSGQLTISKHEIVLKKYLPFKYKAGVDGLAFKGCLYSKIKLKPGKYLHLFNIHAQASYSTEYTNDQHDHF
jgi:hypothetical protein